MPARSASGPQKRPLKTLERVLSKAGLGSRSEARSWIHAGRVTVNGRATENPDQWVDMERDRVRFDGRPLESKERVYLLLHKPTGYLTTYKDPEGRPTVYELISDVGTFLSPVGRLDLDTSGLLLMTNDNRLAERVTNPESHVPKTYRVKATPALTEPVCAIPESSTSIAIARISSTIRMPNTICAKCSPFMPSSESAFTMIVVDEIASIAPRKSESIAVQPNHRPIS